VKRFFALIFLVIFFPIQANEIKTTGEPVALEPAPIATPPRSLQALASYKEELVSRGDSLDDQGVMIERLDSGQVLAEHNADTPFNPASVMKLATSLVALSKFGADYRYRTDILADGEVDPSSRKVTGDLVVGGGCDPMFSQADAQQVAMYLSHLGITRVTGSLRITGPFYYFANGYHLNLSPETSAGKLRSAFQRAGIRIEGATVFGQKSGNLLLSHYSDPLNRILLFQNAHSCNAVAEVVGESVGGATGIQDYLTHDFGLAESEIFVGRASGLEFNRISPKAALNVLRGLIAVLEKYSLKPEDIMPVAGVDSGTLRSRLGGDDIRGSVVAKTGTLGSTDRGVSTLVGIAHTRTDGIVLFAILDTGGGVHGYRRLQDKFVEAFLAEEGGGAPACRLTDALADNIHDSIVQVFDLRRPEPADRVSD